MKRNATGAIPLLVLLTTLTACGEGSGEPSDGAGAPGDEVAVAVEERDAGPSPPPAVASAGEVPMSLSVSVDGRTYEASGAGECKHADPASIYDVLASMWMANYQGGGDLEQLRLTVWQPKGGGADQLGLMVRTADGTHEIDTVTGDGETIGSATVAIEMRGEGGSLSLDGRGAEGTSIRAVIECSTFTGIEAVGG